MQGPHAMFRQLDSRTDEHVARLLGERVQGLQDGLSSLNLQVPDHQSTTLSTHVSRTVSPVANIGFGLQEVGRYWRELHEENDRTAHAHEKAMQEISEVRAQSDADQAASSFALVRSMTAETELLLRSLQKRAGKLGLTEAELHLSSNTMSGKNILSTVQSCRCNL